MATVFFCEEIVIEILKRLPVKSLLRCRSVQKSWYHLIQTLYFINLYSQRNHKKKYLLFHGFYPPRLSLRFDDRQCKEYCPLRFPKDMPEYSDLCTYGTSNGLICLFSLRAHRIYLWNPVIEKYKILPVSPIPYDDPSGVFEVGLAFGYLDKTNDYKIIKIVKYLPPRREEFRPGFACAAYVYSLSTNFWRPFSKDKFAGFSFINLSNSIVLNGVAYWVVSKGLYMNFILCFDMENEMFREIMLPRDSTITNDTVTLVQEFDELMSVFYFNKATAILDIWVLEKDGGLNEVWTKKITLNLGKIVGRRWPDKFNESEIWWPIGFRGSGEMVLVNIKECAFLSYDLEKDEATDMVADSSDLGALKVIYNVYKGFDYHTDGSQPLYLNLFKENLFFLGDY